MAILSVQNIGKSFGGLRALDDVCIDIAEGEISAVIGPNGAGKTTLFNVITGFLKPDKGFITFDGARIDGVAPYKIAQRGLLRTFQLTKLFDRMTVVENVMVGCHTITSAETISILCRRSSVRKEELLTRDLARAALRSVGLEHLADTQAGALPHGQRRLLEIARIMVARPKLVLLDEPTTGLNTREVHELQDMIHSIVEQKTTVVLVEHDMGLVMELAENIHVLDYGRKIAEGPSAAIKKDPSVIEVYLGSSQ